MQQIYLDGLYRKTRKLENSFCSPEANRRLNKLKLYRQLRSEGCSERSALLAINISRATYFRWTRTLNLFVLAPRTPKFNGCVERRNATFKHEFYYRYAGDDSLSEINIALERHENRYNTFRPHQALDQLTPMEYYEKNYVPSGLKKSHM